MVLKQQMLSYTHITNNMEVCRQQKHHLLMILCGALVLIKAPIYSIWFPLKAMQLIPKYIALHIKRICAVLDN